MKRNKRILSVFLIFAMAMFGGFSVAAAASGAPECPVCREPMEMVSADDSCCVWSCEEEVTFDHVPDEDCPYCGWNGGNLRTAEGPRAEIALNGGSGEQTEGLYYVPGEAFVLPVCTLTAPDGAVFDRWQVTLTAEATAEIEEGETEETEPVKTELEAKPGQTVELPENITGMILMPRWDFADVEVFLSAEAGRKDFSLTFGNLPAGAESILFWIFEDAGMNGLVFNATLQVPEEPLQLHAPKDFVPGEYWYAAEVVIADCVDMADSYGSITLAEKPAPAQVPVSFEAGGGFGTMESTSILSGRDYPAPDCGFTAPEGMVFDKWELHAKVDGSIEVYSCTPGTVLPVDVRTSELLFKAVWKEIPKAAEYHMISGTVSSWVNNSSQDARFRSDAPYEAFLRVELDGKELDESHYIRRDDATTVDVKADYMKKLAVGEHTLSIVSEDGIGGEAKATCTFTVKQGSETPKTGDESRSTLWIGLVAAGVLVLAAAVIPGKKKHR